MASRLLLTISSVLSILATHLVGAEVYTVGDEDGWTTGRSYLLWSQKYNFTVGDVLLFNYVRGQHNLYQVTKQVFQTCDAHRGVMQKYTSGRDRVTLTQVANYWFVCNLKGHCQGGMKMSIRVAASASIPNGEASPPPPSPATATTLPGSGTASAGRSHLFGCWWTVHSLYFPLYLIWVI